RLPGRTLRPHRLPSPRRHADPRLAMRLSLIVAADEQDVIGRDGALPWQLPDDLKRFKELTVGHVVIAGRLTHDSIVAQLVRRLPERRRVAGTRQPPGEPVEAEQYAPDVATALERALELAGDDEVFVIGGAQMYEATLPLVQTVHLTRVRGTFDGDTALPPG